MTRPDWLVPGAEVAVLSSSHRSQKLTYTTIDRVLKRDVVLANGDRFNADRRDHSDGAWGPTHTLLPADDPRVVKAAERIAFERDRSRLRMLLSDTESRVRDCRDTSEIAKAIADLRDALDARADQDRPHQEGDA